jgi:predicted nucleic acid-binding protein
MATLIDTSALFVLLDEDDPAHDLARSILGRLRTSDPELVMHSYALTESIALLQRRFGLEAVRRVVDGYLPIIEIAWVDRDLHDRALSALLGSGQRGVSFVDHVSFVLMRDRGIRTAFAFDQDFVAQGFELVSA